MRPSIITTFGVLLAWMIFCGVLLSAHHCTGEARARSRDRWGIVGIALQAVGFALAWGAARTDRGPFISAEPFGQWLLACAAIALAFGGVAFAIAAIRTLGKQWSLVPRVLSSHELVLTGPYRIVRHPIYTAMVGLLVATAIAFGNPLGLALGIVAYALGTRMRIRAEERLLRDAFGEAYDRYAREVPAVIPMPKRIRIPALRRSS